MANPPSSAKTEALLQKLNEDAPPHGQLAYVGTIPFGPAMTIGEYRLENGLRVLLCRDTSAPIVAYHTWFRVGSRHEREGKTGLAHLFEHLMFNETEGLKAGEFDRKLERAGAESNASTWLDWTQYNVAVPRDQLKLVVRLEAERMARLVLKDPQVESEKEVVANERRYRVDDDVEGAVSELLWATAFNEHAYRWPTIGWMTDILGFDTKDCREFYETFYAPNNATVIVVGDTSERTLLPLVQRHYGHLPAATLPVENVRPEPPQTEERRVETTKPTATEKVAIGYHAAALGDFDFPALSLLTEILFGGRSSRLVRRMVRELEIAVDVSGYVGPFRDPGLFEIFASGRDGVVAERLLEVIDEELHRLRSDPVTQAELDRAKARSELALLASLDTMDGKANTIGFYDTVLGQPSAAFDRLEAGRRVTRSDLLRVARRYLTPSSRSVVVVRPSSRQEVA